MRYLLIVVLVIGTGYGAYKWYDTKNAAASESEIVRLLQKGEANRTPQENKILDEYTKNWNEKNSNLPWIKKRKSCKAAKSLSV